jgi:hypothetical protein
MPEYGLYLTGGTTLDYDTVSSYVVTVECSDHRRSGYKNMFGTYFNTPGTVCYELTIT